MNNQMCPICSQQMEFQFQKKILNKYFVSYFSCLRCEFSCTEKPFWLEESYSSAIAESDIGILSRNIYLSTCISNILHARIKEAEVCLDYAGGLGIFTRLMRDIGFNFYWMDKYAENVFAKKYNFSKQKPKVITAFEVIEHFPSPGELIDELKAYNPDGLILLSTELYKSFRPDWWYLVPETGQHVSFFTTKSMKKLAKNKELNYLNVKNLHFFQKKPFGPIEKFFIRINTLPIYRDLRFSYIKRIRSSFINQDFEDAKNY